MTVSSGERQLRRIARDSLVIGVVLTSAAAFFWPERLDRAAGVAGGLALVALSYWGIRAGVDSAWSLKDPAGGPLSRPGFVKFFTRHATLAVSAYVMMARFEFDPVAMLTGVSSPVFAATIECARLVRSRSDGSYSRLS